LGKARVLGAEDETPRFALPCCLLDGGAVLHYPLLEQAAKELYPVLTPGGRAANAAKEHVITNFPLENLIFKVTF
jgi:hypothetical protein